MIAPLESKDNVKFGEVLKENAASDTSITSNESKTAIQRGFQIVMTVLKWLLEIWLWGSVGLFAVWSVVALFFLDYLPKPICILLSIAFAANVVCILMRTKRRRRALGYIAAGVIVTWILWSFVSPRHDRTWVRDQSRLPIIEIDNNDQVTIENFRYAKYRSAEDFDVDYQTRTFAIEQVQAVWFIVQRFSVIDGIAHTFISFELKPDSDSQPTAERYLAVSVEIRREPDEGFSPILGVFRRFELSYMIGDERDLIGVRTNIRTQDEIYLYRTNATPTQAQQMFRDIARRVQNIHEQPEFYNTLTNNCTNNIVNHTNLVAPKPVNPFDLRIVLPGYSDQLAWEQGLIGSTAVSFEEFRRDARVDVRARSVGLSPEFSDDIRREQ